MKNNMRRLNFTRRLISAIFTAAVIIGSFYCPNRIIGEVGLVKIVTFNVKNRDPEIPWEERAEMLGYFVETYEPDVMGMQEVTMDGSEWIKYLPMAFNGDKYAFVGEARTEDPLYGLEATPVYYRKDKYELLDSGTFWLNESGIKGELGWDAAYPRICTYCLLRHRNTEEIFLFMNTHLDNKGREAREKGFELIIAKAKELGADRYPLIITGDMNTAENDEKGLYEKLLSFGDIGDVRHIAAETEGGVTFRSSKSGYPIDYIFVSKKNTRPMKYSILREAFEGKYVSDHFGIYAEIRLTDTAE